MLPHSARPKAQPKARTAAAAAASQDRPPEARRLGRKPLGDDGERVRDLPPVTIRPEPELLARIDAEVARRNRALRPQGYTTSRGAVMVIALREFCERAEAAAEVAPPADGVA